MANKFCRDYLYHASIKENLEKLGEKAYDFLNPNAGRMSDDQYETSRALLNDKYFNDPRGANADGLAPRNALKKQLDEEAEARKRAYNRDYYRKFRERWLKGGRYYEAAKKVLKKLAGAGETIYDKTHKNAGQIDPKLKRATALALSKVDDGLQGIHTKKTALRRSNLRSSLMKGLK